MSALSFKISVYYSQRELQEMQNELVGSVEGGKKWKENCFPTLHCAFLILLLHMETVHPSGKSTVPSTKHTQTPVDVSRELMHISGPWPSSHTAFFSQPLVTPPLTSLFSVLPQIIDWHLKLGIILTVHQQLMCVCTKILNPEHSTL